MLTDEEKNIALKDLTEILNDASLVNPQVWVIRYRGATIVGATGKTSFTSREEAVKAYKTLIRYSIKYENRVAKAASNGYTKPGYHEHGKEYSAEVRRLAINAIDLGDVTFERLV